MKKIIVLLFAFGVLAALSPAPQKGRHLVNTVPVTTESLLEHDQALAQNSGPIGSVQLSPKQNTEAEESSDSDAAQAVSSSLAKKPQNSAEAAQVVTAAGKNAETAHRSPILSFFWISLAGCFGYGLFFAFRRWADKNIPQPGHFQRH